LDYAADKRGPFLQILQQNIAKRGCTFAARAVAKPWNAAGIFCQNGFAFFAQNFSMASTLCILRGELKLVSRCGAGRKYIPQAWQFTRVSLRYCSRLSANRESDFGLPQYYFKSLN